MIFADAHVHPADWLAVSGAAEMPAEYRMFCACAAAAEEFACGENLRRKAAAEPGGRDVRLAFGVRPQLPAVLARQGVPAAEIPSALDERLALLETLAARKKLDALGETGLDAFTPDFAATLSMQERLMDAQFALAARYGLPVVLHLRRASALLFQRVRVLRNLPAVVFHGWSGTAGEALSLLRRGVNAWFSFGKVILRGSRKAAGSLCALPAERLLFETDAPYMTLRGEAFSSPQDIARVYAAAAGLLEIPPETLAETAAANFRAAFGVTAPG